MKHQTLKMIGQSKPNEGNGAFHAQLTESQVFDRGHRTDCDTVEMQKRDCNHTGGALVFVDEFLGVGIGDVG